MKTNSTPVKSTLNTKPILAASTLLAGAIISGPVQADAMKADFNGDGLEDLAIGMPYEGFGNLLNPGAAKVVYGRPKGEMGPLNKTAYLHLLRF